jgi:biopolymer transport protein ExbB
MFDLIARGGFFMYPIAFCSVAAIGIFLERIWALRRRNVNPPDFMEHIEDLLRKNKISEAVFLCQGYTAPISKVFLAGLKKWHGGFWVVKEAIEERGSREARALERNIGILSTIANLTPLLGLLGTVSGMIKIFNNISFQGTGSSAGLAGGIAEALITTAAGLCVAIPALVCYRFLRERVDSLVSEMEENSLRIMELIEHIGIQGKT